MGSKDDVKEKLLACLRELHLPTFRECFEELARRAAQETSSYEQYLLELVQRECQVRCDKRTERLLRHSRLLLENSLSLGHSTRREQARVEPETARTPWEEGLRKAGAKTAARISTLVDRDSAKTSGVGHPGTSLSGFRRLQVWAREAV